VISTLTPPSSRTAETSSRISIPPGRPRGSRPSSILRRSLSSPDLVADFGEEAHEVLLAHAALFELAPNGVEDRLRGGRGRCGRVVIGLRFARHSCSSPPGLRSPRTPLAVSRQQELEILAGEILDDALVVGVEDGVGQVALLLLQFEDLLLDGVA